MTVWWAILGGGPVTPALVAFVLLNSRLDIIPPHSRVFGALEIDGFPLPWALIGAVLCLRK